MSVYPFICQQSVCLYQHSDQTYELISQKLGTIIDFNTTYDMSKKSPDNGYHGPQKRAKSGTSVIRTLGATDLKLVMHTQLDSESRMNKVPQSHTCLSHGVKLKGHKLVLLK